MSLSDKYAQDVRPNSNIILRQYTQRIEQGIGRGIRGPSDWCIVIATGGKLTNFLSEKQKIRFFSKYTSCDWAINKHDDVIADEIVSV